MHGNGETYEATLSSNAASRSSSFSMRDLIHVVIGLAMVAYVQTSNDN